MVKCGEWGCLHADPDHTGCAQEPFHQLRALWKTGRKQLVGSGNLLHGLYGGGVDMETLAILSTL